MDRNHLLQVLRTELKLKAKIAKLKRDLREAEKQLRDLRRELKLL